MPLPYFEGVLHSDKIWPAFMDTHIEFGRSGRGKGAVEALNTRKRGGPAEPTLGCELSGGWDKIRVINFPSCGKRGFKGVDGWVVLICLTLVVEIYAFYIYT